MIKLDCAFRIQLIHRLSHELELANFLTLCITRENIFRRRKWSNLRKLRARQFSSLLFYMLQPLCLIRFTHANCRFARLPCNQSLFIVYWLEIIGCFFTPLSFIHRLFFIDDLFYGGTLRWIFDLIMSDFWELSKS